MIRVMADRATCPPSRNCEILPVEGRGDRMPKQPRKPRAIKRTTDTKPERIASRIVGSRPDLRQAGLFDLPPTWIAPCLPTLVRTAPTGAELAARDQA